MQNPKIHPFFGKALHAMKVLEELEQWSGSELTALQLERINQVWITQLITSPATGGFSTRETCLRRFGSLNQYRAIFFSSRQENCQKRPDPLGKSSSRKAGAHKCGACGADVSLRSEFCVKCGAALIR